MENPTTPSWRNVVIAAGMAPCGSASKRGQGVAVANVMTEEVNHKKQNVLCWLFALTSAIFIIEGVKVTPLGISAPRDGGNFILLGDVWGAMCTSHDNWDGAMLVRRAVPGFSLGSTGRARKI